MLTSENMTALAERWGNPRTEETLIHLSKSRDHNGLFIIQDLNYEHVDKVMMAIYAPEHVTVDDGVIVVKNFTG